MNRSRKEYFQRLNRVVDYIEKNLSDELSLDKLASIAHFSPYHFHRIFRALMDEPLHQYIRRKRIEKAASLLIRDKDTPVSEIAYNTGYDNFSVFCRNFRDHYGMNAQDFRERKGEQISKNGQTESKNGQFNSSWLDEIYNPITNQTWREIMNQNIKIKEMPGLDLVYLTHMGQFNQIGNAYNRLMQWAGPRGLLSDPEVKTVTVYHDDPSVTDIEKVRQSACITVKVDVKPDGEFGKMSIEGGKHVVGRFEIDETQFEQAWNSVCLWMSESGYQPGDGLPYELYHKDPQDHPERKFLLDICIPVKPL